MTNDHSPHGNYLPVQAFLLVLAQLFVHVAFAELVPFDSTRWIIEAEEHELSVYGGRQALSLKNGQAWIEDVEMTNGVIEFDIAFTSERGFSGAIWRMTDTDNFEEFYLRHHLSGNPDANQYTPIFNGNAAWQLYYGPAYAAPISYRFNEWMHVKIVFFGTQAEVYIDSASPVLEIPDLKHEIRAGKVGISSSFAPAYFSNFSIEPRTEVLPRFSETAVTARKEGTIDAWLVSGVFSHSELDNTLTLDQQALSNYDWRLFEAETDGITNLAQAASLSENRDTLFARAILESQLHQVSRLEFGYSDKAKLFVNGKLVYEGSNVYRSRDYRFLGTIGMFDSVYVELNPGSNEILFAVQENFGGWGLMARLDEHAPVKQRTRDYSIQQSPGQTESLTAKLDSVISLRSLEDGFSGSVLVSRRGETLLHKSYGIKQRSHAQQEPAYWIASNSKQFTGAAVALLAHEGKLDIDAKLGTYLEDVPANKRSITIRQLLTHTSGLDHVYASEGIRDRKAATQAILQANLINAPGTAYSYSNDGFSLLAILVELTSGQAFEEYVQQRLLDPAGMTHTGFWGFEQQESMAQLEDPQAAENQVATIYDAGLGQPNWGYRGASGMYSTTADLGAWITRLLKLGSNSDNPLAPVISPQQIVREVEGMGLVSYGFGIAVVIREGSFEMISHNGDDDWLGHSSTVTAYADGDVIIVLSNSGYLEDGTPWSAEITRAVRNLLRN